MHRGQGVVDEGERPPGKGSVGRDVRKCRGGGGRARFRGRSGFGLFPALRREAAGCWRPWTAKPAVARIRAAATAASGFNFASHISLITPWARAATAAGMGAGRGRTCHDFLRGLFDDAAAGIAAEASRPSRPKVLPRRPERARRRTKRRAAASCPRDRRLSTVPTGQPSRARGLLVRQTLQVAKQNRRALALRKAADFFVQDRKLLGAFWITEGRAGDRLDSAGPTRPPPHGGARARAATRRPRRRATAPSESSTLTARALRIEHQERRLKGVVCGIWVGQQPTTHSPDHRTVPLDEDGERILGRGVIPVQEPFQQLPVGQPAEYPATEQRTDATEHAGRISSAHEPVSHLPPCQR